MPWVPRVSKDELSEAIADADSWRDAMDALGYAYHGKNIATVRKWAERWGVSTAHLSDNRGGRRVRYSDDELREAVSSSTSWAGALRLLGYCPSGGNWRTLKKRVAALGISTEHFDPYAHARRQGARRRIPLVEVLVVGSTYSRSSLKNRLFENGLKQRLCELCGQGEVWKGQRIGLILDHANGVRDDNRLENLRIVCPNCAAGLETHCGRKNRIDIEARSCIRCSERFVPKYPKQHYCSSHCGRRWDRHGLKRPGARRVERPPYEPLLRDVSEMGYSAVGRKYGVSDNAVRKWLRQYERERAIAAGNGANPAPIPTRPWPSPKRDGLDEAA